MEYTRKLNEFVTFVLKAMAVSMSAAAIVLGVLGTVAPAALITLLAMGLFCLAMAALKA